MTTDHLLEYIKLADAAEDSAVHVINAMAEKYPLGADFERYNDDIRKMVEFCTDDATALLAKALIEADEKMKNVNSCLTAMEQLGKIKWEETLVCKDLRESIATIQRIRNGEAI